MTIDTTVLSVLFAFFGAFYSALLAVAIVHRRRHRAGPEPLDTVSRFTLLIPARDEEAVLGRTLDGIARLDYPADRVEVLVVDDGSTDGTLAVARAAALRHAGRIRVLAIPPGASGRGKAEALNFGLRHALRCSRFREDPEWVVGVFDADGVPDADLLQKASARFRDPEVGAVQASVRIANRDASRLARFQDIEFSAFSRVTQMIRSRLTDSASLGGNGQFVRASALVGTALPGKPLRCWRPGALTEDLELSTRLTLGGWKVQHLATGYVHQEGVVRVRDLLRQRTRWAWGSLQVFVEYFLTLKVLRTRPVPLRRRLDLTVSLSLFLLSPLVLVVWFLTLLALLDVVQVTNLLPVAMTLGISFGFLPIVAWGMWDQREYRRVRLPVDLLLFVAYTYHWLPCLYVAAFRVLGRDEPRWFRTPRLGGSTPARAGSPPRSPRVAKASGAAFLLLLAVAAALRWARAGYLDPFEDAYQHWWIAGSMIETGQYADSFSAMVRGNWLPLYDFLVAGALRFVGLHGMEALKAVSLGASLATLGVVFLIGRAHRREAGWLAAVFFAASPSAIIAGSLALPEAVVGLALIAGYYLAFHAPAAWRWRLPGAGVAFLAAVSLRYEAWLFLAVVVGFALLRRPRTVTRGEILLVASPAVLFAMTWWLFTSRWGFLPSIILAQTSVDVSYKASIGALPPLPEYLWTFWSGYLLLSAVPVVLGTAYAVRAVRRNGLATVLLVFYAAELLWIVLGLGTPSARYLYVTVPGLCVLAGMAASDIRKRLQGVGVAGWRRAGRAFAVGVLLLVAGGVVHDGYATAVPAEAPGLYMLPMERAGRFLAGLELPDGKVLVSESPIAAYMSGYPPSRIVGSASLPDDPESATRVLQQTAAYLVVVTVPWYKLRRLFPDLADGRNTPAFRLLFDGSGPEYARGAHRVLVYAVLPPPGGSP